MSAKQVGAMMILAAIALLFASLHKVGWQSLRSGNIVFQIFGMILAIVLGLAGLGVAIFG